MVSETEAIAELSCTREHPSLIHYAARHGQVTHTHNHTHKHKVNVTFRRCLHFNIIININIENKCVENTYEQH